MSLYKDTYKIPDYAEQYINHVIHKVSFFAESNKWDGHLRKPNIFVWLKNFESEDGKYIACKLLDKFIYYSELETGVICKYLLSLLKRDIIVELFNTIGRMPTETEINSKWSYVYSNAIFLPMDDSNPSNSGLVICRKMRDMGVSSDSFAFSKDVPNLIDNGIKYFVFIDDLIGTGTQATDFWNDKDTLLGGQSLNDISLSNLNVKFYYLSIAGTQKGIDKVYKNSNNLKLLVSEILTGKHRLFSEECDIWESEEERLFAERYVNEIGDKLGLGSFKKGFGNLALSIAFSHCIPDNTLPLFWYEGNGWKPLIRRVN